MLECYPEEKFHGPIFNFRDHLHYDDGKQPFLGNLGYYNNIFTFTRRFIIVRYMFLEEIEVFSVVKRKFVCLIKNSLKNKNNESFF